MSHFVKIPVRSVIRSTEQIKIFDFIYILKNLAKRGVSGVMHEMKKYDSSLLRFQYRFNLRNK